MARAHSALSGLARTTQQVHILPVVGDGACSLLAYRTDSYMSVGSSCSKYGQFGTMDAGELVALKLVDTRNLKHLDELQARPFGP